MSRNFELLQQLNGSPDTGTYSGLIPVSDSWKASVRPAERCPANDPRAGMDIEEHNLLHRLFLDVRPSPRVVVFTGLDSGSGCTYLCARAAELLAAKTNGTICMVDANLRSPSLHRCFGIENAAGLADALIEAGEIRSYARQLPQERLWLVTAGTEVPDAYMLLASERLNGYIAELRASFDYVLIDSPAASLYTDSVVLGSMSDGVALVVKANAGRRSTAGKIVGDFAAAHVRLLGAVLNQRTFPVPQAIYARL